jgi:hypothetical protein
LYLIIAIVFYGKYDGFNRIDIFMSDKLKEIGLLPKVNTYNDQNNTVFSSKMNSMRVVDLVPVYFALDISNLFESTTEAKKIVTVDYPIGIKEYQQKLEQIKVSDTNVSGLRLWVTGDSSTQEELSNNYKENKFVEMYEQAMDNNRQYIDVIKSTGKRFFQQDSGFSIGSSAMAIATDGRQLSLPRIWQRSDFTTGLTLTIRLISPYGSKESFKKHIAEPLLYLMALVSPSSYDGITYGLPPFIYIRGYGNTYMPLASPKSFSITRNGGEGHINRFKQPLDVSINMAFEHALPGFGALLVNDSTAATLETVTEEVNADEMNFAERPNITGMSTLSSIIESLRPYKDTSVPSPPPPQSQSQVNQLNVRIDSEVYNQLLATNINVPSNFKSPTNIWEPV